MRYIAEYLRPPTFTPTLGTMNVLVRHYSSDRNALRYMHRHLAAGHFPPGQYRLSTWPVRGEQRIVGTLYKTA